MAENENLLVYVSFSALSLPFINVVFVKAGESFQNRKNYQASPPSLSRKICAFAHTQSIAVLRGQTDSSTSLAVDRLSLVSSPTNFFTFYLAHLGKKVV